MKYKLLGIVAVCLGLLCALAVTVTADSSKPRVHQHLTDAPYTACGHTDNTFCTHLPLVVIDTQELDIPGRMILNENGAIVGLTKTKGMDVIPAKLAIIDNGNQNNHLSDTAQIQSHIRISVRGNSSRMFDKASYSIRLVDEAGENAPQAVMGMDAHHEWALHGPFLDQSLIRNYMWYNIAGEIMDYAPNVRFCEVVLNGEHQGLYVMTETITAGRNGARLELSVNKKDNMFSGYLLRLDRGSENNIKNIDSFTTYTYRNPLVLNIEYPGAANLTPEMAEAIRQDFSDFEKALYSFDYDSDTYGYKAQIDMASFADYFIINEVTSNYDAGWLSTYVYKGTDNRYRMCVWDFNSACDAYEEQTLPRDVFQLQHALWFHMLIKSPDFTDLIIDRYRELRKTTLSDAALDRYITDTIDYLGPAIERNFKVWENTFSPGKGLLIPSERNPRSYEEAVEDLRAYLDERLAWMDENIETLRQYSADSKVKKYNEHTD